MSASPKNSSTSKSYPRPRGNKRIGKKVSGTTKRFIPDFEGQDPRINVSPRKRKDPEKAPPPDDKASKLKYPPPKINPIFRQKWESFLPNIMARENFNPTYLEFLEILCDLYVEYDTLQKFVRTQGRTYKSYGRQGLVMRTYPEVALLATCQRSIKDYSKMLGLTLKPDKGETPKNQGEWD